MNSDPSELQKFSDIAQRWWDADAEFRPLHDINPLRLRWIQRYASLAGKTALDIGCGGGILSESLARAGADVTGIDLSEAALKVAELHSLDSGIPVRYELIAAEELAQREPEEYDIVTCMEMLEHVPDPASIIQACHKLVKPGGHVFFSTINRNPKSYLFAIIGAEYILRMLAKGTHDYSKFIKPSELAHDIRNAGLKLKDMTGLHYNPLTKRYWLAPNVDVNYMVYTVKESTQEADQ